MSLQSQMLQVLGDRQTSRISFSFSGSTGLNIEVKPSSFLRVGEAIRGERITVSEGGVPPGTAQYDSEWNVFRVARGQEWSRAYNALLVHEAVHAAFDLARSRLPWLDNETAAYIAQGYYLRNSGFPRSRLDELGQPYLGLLLVDSIIRDGSPDSELMQELQGTLLSSPQYHNYIRREFIGDG